MYDGAFTPRGPTYLVGTNAVYLQANDGGIATSYRICNLLTTRQYLTWWAGNTQAMPNITAAAPSANNPATYTMGFAGTSTETVVLPSNVWVKADGVAAFEITPGEGL